MSRGSRTFTISTIASKALVAALLATTAMPASIALIETDAFAQASAQTSFNVPAGPLARALATFGSQSGTQVSYDASIASGKTSPGMSGAATREQALAQILQGSGLTYSFSDPASVVITDRISAAHAPVDDDGSFVLDTITVSGGGNLANTPYETAGSSSYISLEQIERFRGTSPADILKGEAGVLSGESRNSGALDVNIRGLQGYGRNTVTIDGAQQNSSMDRGYFGDANRTFIDPDLIGGVVVTKGPSNTPSSSGALGGTAALNTISADDIVKPGNTWGIRIRSGFNDNSTSPPPKGTTGGIEKVGGTYIYDSNVPGQSIATVPSEFGDTVATGRPSFLTPTGGNGSVAIATKQENFELLGAIAYRDNGNYYAGTHGNHARIGVTTSDRSSFITTQANVDRYDALYPGHGVQVGDTLYREYASYGNIGISEYRAGEEILNTHSKSFSGLLKAKANISDDSTIELSYMRNQMDFGFIWPSSLKFSTRPAVIQNSPATSNIDTITAKYNYNPSDSDLLNLTINSWYTHQSLHEIMESVGINEIRDDNTNTRMAGFDISNISEFSGGWGDLTLQYGAAYRNQKFKQESVKESFFVAGTPFRIYREEQDGAAEQADIFINSTWQPVDWLTADFGMRYISSRSAKDQRFVELLYGPEFNPGFLDPTRRSDDGFAPSVALAGTPFDGVQIFGSYKEGWRAPSGVEMRDLDAVDGPSQLMPERSRSYELGANYLGHDVFTGGDTFGFKAVYFNNTIDNYIMMDFEDRILTTKNYNKAQFSGVELSTKYDSGRFFAEASAIYYDKVALCPQADRCWSSRSDEGIPLNDWRNQVPPEYTASLTLGGRFLDEKLMLGGRLNYIGDRAGQPDASTSAGVQWEAYTTVDVFGSYKITDSLAIDFAVENVFDKFYVDPLAMAMQPGPGRTARFNMTAHF